MIGVVHFAGRFADLAEAMSRKESDPKRKRELEDIARICGRVPFHPPENFREALQSVWFIHLISQIESNGHSMSLGRFDQYMYDYYRRDREAGIITKTARWWNCWH